MWKRIPALVAVLALAPLSASGQQQEPAQPQDTVPRTTWHRASSNNWYLRLIVPGPDTIAGRVRYTRGQARIDGNILPDNILRVERRIERGNGALVGGLIGFLAGGLLGAGLAEGLSDGEPGAGLWGFGVVGGLGSLFGMLSGQLASPGRVEWEPVWTVQDPDR